MPLPQPVDGPLNLGTLTAAITASTGRRRVVVRDVLDAFVDVVALATAAGHNVSITNFGTWRSYRTGHRKVSNPRTGRLMTVEAHWKVRFQPAPRLAAVVREHRPRHGALRKLPARGPR